MNKTIVTEIAYFKIVQHGELYKVTFIQTFQPLLHKKDLMTHTCTYASHSHTHIFTCY